MNYRKYIVLLQNYLNDLAYDVTTYNLLFAAWIEVIKRRVELQSSSFIIRWYELFSKTQIIIPNKELFFVDYFTSSQQAESDNNIFPYPLQDILETWTIQMGYPLITVSRDPQTNKIIVSQEVFLMDPEDTPGEPQPGVTYK